MGKYYLLDASAVLAGILGETGQEKLSARMQEPDRTCLITTVNASEVLAKLVDHGFTDKQANDALEALALVYVPVDMAIARKAAALRPSTRSIGASLGDRICLAAALVTGATAITTDRAWTKVSISTLSMICIR